jgi:iron complex transport system permease protein
MTAQAKQPLPYWGLVAGFVLLLALATIASLMIGTGGEANQTSIFSLFESDPKLAHIILFEVRLPRTLLGLIVGATLGLSGAALQGLLRNPLAEPGLVGTSSGAALGAVIVFYFAIGGTSGFLVPFGGMAGALLALVVLYALTGRDSNIMTLILAGVAINSFAGAMTSLALNLAPSPFAALEIVFWMLGSLADRSMEHVQIALPLTLVGWALLLSTGRPLDALTLGEDTAASLGYNRAWVRARVIGGTGLAVGAAVSVTGVIGFVGLVVPHLMRPLVGHRPSRLLIPSALAGALLTLVADMGVRLMPFGPELKLGVVTSIIGAPFFLYLLLRSRRAQL